MSGVVYEIAVTAGSALALGGGIAGVLYLDNKRRERKNREAHEAHMETVDQRVAELEPRVGDLPQHERDMQLSFEARHGELRDLPPRYKNEAIDRLRNR